MSDIPIGEVLQREQDAERNAKQNLVASVGALVYLLIDKGVFTSEEFERAMVMVNSQIDQEIAAKKEQVRKDLGESGWLALKLFGMVDE